MSEPAAFPNLSLDDPVEAPPLAIPVVADPEPVIDEAVVLDDPATVGERARARLLRDLDIAEVKKLPEGRRRAALLPVVRRLLDEEPHLDRADRDRLAEELLDDLLGLGPLEPLLRDPSITEILVNGPDEAFVERRGRLEESPLRFRDADHLMQVIDRIVSRVGRRVDESSPMVDARLPDGSRVNAVVAPLALKGPTLSIRRFGATPLTLEDLLQARALTREMAHLLEAAVRARLNIVVSGGTGSGKTTLLNILSSFIPPRERIITLEDAAELRLQQRHVVALETRPPNVEGKGGVSMRDLLRNSLRMRPDRIIVGECRGAEALDMMQAMNSGHEGSLTTLHANGPRDALTRLETMILMAGIDLPLRAMRRQIASAVHVIVQAERLAGGPRRVTSISEVVGMEGDIIVSQEVYAFHQTGVDGDGRAVGQFQATGIRPGFWPRLRAAGVDVPASLFQQRVLLRA
jgi:pilus assembly protein CpaF